MDKLPRLTLVIATSLLVGGLLATPDADAQAPKKRDRLADYFGFQPLEIYKLEHRIGNLMLRDLDGDKAEDIVVSNNSRSRIDLFLSSRKPEDDQSNRPFRKEVNDLSYDKRMRPVSLPVNKAVVSLDTGDFNGDGKPDLVFYGTPAEVQILFNEGPGRFGGIKKVNTGEGVERASALTVGDINQDGRDDIVLLDGHELVFVYQTATGVLSEPERVPHTAENPWLVRMLDLDVDGIKDLVMLDGSRRPPDPRPVRHAREEARPRGAIRHRDAPRGGLRPLDDRAGSEILTVENQSGRARVLTLDRSANDEGNRRGRLVFFALPQGNDRGRSMALGDLDGDGHERHRRHGSRPTLRSWRTSSRAAPASAPARPSPAWPECGPSASPTSTMTRRTRCTSSPSRRSRSAGASSRRRAGSASRRRCRSSATRSPWTSPTSTATALPEILYVARVTPGVDAFALRALTREESGTLRPFKLGRLRYGPALRGEGGPGRDRSPSTSTPTASPT